MNRNRTYTQHSRNGPHVINTWRIVSCRYCGRFLPKGNKTTSCHKCSEKYIKSKSYRAMEGKFIRKRNKCISVELQNRKG